MIRMLTFDLTLQIDPTAPVLDDKENKMPTFKIQIGGILVRITPEIKYISEVGTFELFLNSELSLLGGGMLVILNRTYAC